MSFATETPQNNINKHSAGDMNILKNSQDFSYFIKYYLEQSQKSPRKEKMIKDALEALKKTGKPHFWMIHFSSIEMAKLGKSNTSLLPTELKSKMNVDYFIQSFPANLKSYDSSKEVVVLVFIDSDERGMGDSSILKP